MERTKTLAQLIAGLIQARANCAKSGNDAWFVTHTQRLTDLCRNFLPSGAGIDAGCTLDFNKSTSGKIVIFTQFHHMTEHGFYDRWTDHTITIRPAFEGFEITVSGKNWNDIKDYLADTFDIALRQLITETADGFSPAKIAA